MGPDRAPGPRLAGRLRTLARAAASADLRELLAAGLEALSRYKLRTGLSVLGVVLGVAAVIAMLSVSEGAREQTLREIELLGLNNVIVREAFGEDPGRRSLEAADAALLRQAVPLVEAASPLTERVTPVRGDRGDAVAPVLGVGEAFGRILGLGVDRGRLLGPLDLEAAAPVCVLGAHLARALFSFLDPLGRSVAVEGRWFRVVGVLSERGRGPGGGGALSHRDLNQAVLVPLSALQDTRPSASAAVQEIWLHLSRGDRVVEVGRIVEHTLARLPPGPRRAEVFVPRELLKQRHRVQRTFAVVVGSVAAISLLVGGIGIMNIMLASVLERTHEIGIRRTVGATRRDITAQFLAEAVLMTLAGGLAGILTGVVLSWGVTAYAGWSTRVSFQAVVLATTVAVVVGLAFGIYPATRAARLDPIEALRYE